MSSRSDMTLDEQLQQIHEALAKHGGVRAKAAEALGLEVEKLSAMVNKHPRLREVWQRSSGWKQKPMTPDEIHTRQQQWREQDTELPMKRVDAKLVTDEVINIENGRLKQGLVGIKLTDPEISFALGLQELWGVSFAKMQDILGGSVSQQAIKLAMEFDRNMVTLETGKTMDEATGELRSLTLEELVLTREWVKDLNHMTRGMFEGVNRGRAMKDAVDLKRDEMRGGGPRSKPGWSPLGSGGTLQQFNGPVQIVKAKDEPPNG